MLKNLLPLLALVFTACQEPSNNSTTNQRVSSESSLESNEPIDDSPKAQYRYVAAPSGLHLRKGKGRKSESLAKLPYGTELSIDPTDHGTNFAVDHLSGQMVAAQIDGQSGYVFSAYLLSLPTPPLVKEQNERYGFVKKYVKDLGQAKATFGRVAGSETTVFKLELPLLSEQEAFLLMRELFFIPREYDFPLQDEVMLSTPENPSEAAEKGPYDSVTETFRWLGEGADRQLRYYNDSEVGGMEISLSWNEKTVMVIDEWSH